MTPEEKYRAKLRSARRIAVKAGRSGVSATKKLLDQTADKIENSTVSSRDGLTDLVENSLKEFARKFAELTSETVKEATEKVVEVHVAATALVMSVKPDEVVGKFDEVVDTVLGKAENRSKKKLAMVYRVLVDRHVRNAMPVVRRMLASKVPVDQVRQDIARLLRGEQIDESLYA